jgi:hypothetical protein
LFVSSRAECETTPRRPSALSFNSDDGNFVLLPLSQSVRQSTTTSYRQHSPPMTTSSCVNSCSDVDSNSGKPPLPPRSRPMPRTTKYQDQAHEVSLINGINRMFMTNEVRNASPTLSQPTLRRVPRMGTRLNLNLNLNLNASSVSQRNSNLVSSDCGYQQRIDQCDEPSCCSPGHDYCVIADEMGNCFQLPALSPSQSAVVDKVCLQPLQPEDFSRVSSPPPLPFVLLSPRSGCASPTNAGVVYDSDAAAVRRSTRSRLSPTDGLTSRGTQTMAAAEAYEKCADVMYTNHANLQHTIAVQQRLFRQQLADRRRRFTSPTSADRTPTAQYDETADNAAGASASSGCCSSQGAERLEWVVRRRSDGSRYVARRPVNASALRMPSADSVHRRPSSAAKTTSVLLSTGKSVAEAWTTTDDDDDECDSPKAGRYWTREQRRQHVADRRRRAALKQQAREAAAAAAAASVISPTDNRLRRGLSRVRRDLATELAVVDGLKIVQHHRSAAEAGGHKRLFNANCNLLSVATV